MNGGASFHPANNGFSERQISSITANPQNPDSISVGVVNDKRFGGVFMSQDAGETWKQSSEGLNGNDVFALASSADGNLLAGTNHGIFRWNNGRWQNVSNRLKARVRKVTHYRKKHRYVTTETTYVPDGRIEVSVRGIAFSDGDWYAATADGLYSSEDRGFVWKGGPVNGNHAFTAVAANADTVIAAGPSMLAVSQDRAKTWHIATPPSGWQRVRYVVVDPNGKLWIGGRLGVAFSQDQGQTWENSGVPINDISGLRYDPQLKRILATSYRSDLVFGVSLVDKHWVWWNPGWRAHSAVSSRSRLVAATLLHGVIVQPANEQPAGQF